jgi:tetratricopeptide (TPR) repeat protein
MRRVLLSIFLFFLMFPALIHAQRDSLRRAFLDAESWFLFEEYADALPLYESLLESDPGNDKLKYKIGICLLNDPYQKDRAISYLLDASNNINPAYRPNNFREKAAPPDALYYLGNAYLVNELLDRAIESFEEFLEIMDHSVYDEELVLAQIQSCRNAQRLKNMPVDMDLLLLDTLINTRYPDVRPVISGDGSKMAFVTELPFYDGAFFTEKQGDGWSPPRMITQMLGFDSDGYPVALSYDGSEMILYFDDDYIGNLYYSRMVDGRWTPATKMNNNISTKYWESHACFSKDGQSLYFTSNRKGGHGGLDIYRSEKQSDGKWGTPVNLGDVINTRYNEESPHISEDGQCLYFSSYGHYNMGGYDIFCSRRNADGSWSKPVNMGYPINTTDDDLYFQAIDKGNGAYFAVYSPRGMGAHDIYYMNIYSASNPRYYPVNGSLHTEDGGRVSSPVSIYLVDAASRDTLEHGIPDEEGKFELNLTRGNYELHFSGEGYQDLIRPLEITTASDKQGIRLAEALIMKREAVEAVPERKVIVYEGEDSRIRIRETQVEQTAGMPLRVDLLAPRGSILSLRTYQDQVLVSTDTLVTERRRAQLQLLTLAGVSEVVVELTDQDGNIHRNRLQVVGTVPEDDDALVSRETVLEVGELPAGEETAAPPGAGADESVWILLHEMRRGSKGALQEYLLGLDPDKEDLQSQQDLLEHLEAAVRGGAFTREELQSAMENSLGYSLEVKQLYEQALIRSEGICRQILENMDLEGSGIYRVDQFIELLDNELERKRVSKKEREEILAGLPGAEYGRPPSGKRNIGWLLGILLALLAGWLIWFLLAGQKRRRKGDQQGH